ncbi:MAG: exopolysaccharide biosynthesis polyprenyl glycosylphosphotransferase [Bdellovibrionia bacterium]
MSPILGFKNKLFLMLADLVLFAAVMQVVTQLRLSSVPGSFYFELPFLIVAAGVLTGLYVFGCYDLDHGLNRRDLALRKAGALLISLGGILLVNYLLSFDRAGVFGRGILLGSLFLFFVLSFIYRWAISQLLNKVIEKLKWLILIDGSSKTFFEADLGRLGFLGQVEYFDAQKQSLENLQHLLGQKWSAVVVGVKSSQVPAPLFDLLMAAKFAGTRVMDLSQFYEKNWSKVPIYFLEPEWFISSEGFRRMTQPLSLRIKRISDIILALFIFVLSLPFMVLTALAIQLESPGGVIYKQIRTGKNGKEFFIYKFRSMRSDAEKAGAQWAQKNDARVTKVGKFIRKTRLDELPQLWNVLKGDMSFVGPRPERPEFNIQLAKEINFYNLRHTMQPGLTGWAQVLYPYGASVEDAREKLQYELYYAKHFNLLMDAYIFLKTVRVVLFGRGR